MFHKILFAIILVALSFVNALGQKKPSPTSVIMTVDGKKVTVEDFLYTYKKKHSKSDNIFSKESITEYLNLYKEFQLKVTEAEHQQLDTLPNFIREFKKYEKSLAKPYLTEPSFNEKLAKEVYDRQAYEIRTSHILLRLTSDASPKDTLRAYNKLDSIRNVILNGADFGTMAFQFSEDPSAQTDGLGSKGDLGYMTALNLVYPYENAMYNTSIGSVSKPFRTQFGYHILKVNDRRDSEGEIILAHILIQAADGVDEETAKEAKEKVDKIYKELQNNGNWKELCSKYSEDKNSSRNGGRLSPITRGKTGLVAFENIGFNLSEGEYSQPVKTPYGWHILKLLEKSKGKSFDELKEKLIKQVKGKPRAQLNKKAFIERLKKENTYILNDDIYTKVLELSDERLIHGNWIYNENASLVNQKLFSINGESTKAKAFLEYVKRRQVKRPDTYTPQYIFSNYFTEYANDAILKYEESHLKEKYPEYRLLVQEYRDGILLFDLMSKEVWNKAMKDSAGIEKFYNAHKFDKKDSKNNKGTEEHKYKWKERRDITIYTLNDSTQLDLLREKIDSAYSHEDLLDLFNTQSPFNLKIKSHKYERGANKIVDQVAWDQKEAVIKDHNKSHLVIVSETLPPAFKKLSEARGLVISDYQDELKDKWIKVLEGKYKIKVNKKVVKQLIQ